MSDTTATRRSRKGLVIAVAVAVLAALLAGGWYFFIRDDAPDAFDIDTASEGVGADDGSSDSGDEGDEPDDGAISDSVEGDWVIDPSSDGTSAGFRVDEELANIGATTAVGRTSDVEGELTIEGTSVTAVDVTVDVSTLETDDSRRDGRMRSALDTEQFPTATFTLTEPIDLGTLPEEGETISVTAAGEMTIKGTTNPVEVDLDARLVDGTLVVVGSSPVVFSDYGVEAPTSPIALSVDDEGVIEFQLFFSRA